MSFRFGIGSRRRSLRPTLSVRLAVGGGCLAASLLLLGPASGKATAMKTFDSNGVKLAYREAGDPKGYPVILVHGFMADNRVQWDSPAVKGPKVVDALIAEKKYRIILLDSRGHGESEKPVDPKKYGAEMADDVGRLMTELKVAKAHLVGYSMGSWAVQKFAAEHPDQVRTLTVGGAGRLGDAELAGLKGIAAGLQEYAKGKKEVTAYLEKKFDGWLPLPAVKDAPALLAAADGAGGLKLTPPADLSYPGKVLGLVGDKDPLRPGVVSLRDDRVAAKKEMELPDVSGTHLSAPADPSFSKALVKFLGANTP